MNQPYYVAEKVSATNQVDALTRQLLRDKVAMLSESSRARFYAIWSHPYPDCDPIEKMSERQLLQSIGLVDRTLEAATRAAVSANQTQECTCVMEGEYAGCPVHDSSGESQ